MPNKTFRDIFKTFFSAGIIMGKNKESTWLGKFHHLQLRCGIVNNHCFTTESFIDFQDFFEKRNMPVSKATNI